MKPLVLVLVIAGCFFISACAHQAQRFTAPDSSKLGAANSKLATRVMEARATAGRASVAVKEAKSNADAESKTIDAIAPRVENLLRITPPELRPEVEALHNDVTTLQMEHAATLRSVVIAQKEQADLTGQLEEANAAKNEVAKYGPEYQAAVDKQTEELNAAQTAWAKDSAELVKLKTHSLLYRIAAILGLLAVAGVAFLWFTGRIAKAGASIASHL